MNRSRFLALTLLALVSIATASPTQKTDGFWKRVLKFLGVSATPGNQKGDEDLVKAGNIRLYDVLTRVGSDVKQGSFRSPIFLPDNENILTIEGERVVRITLSSGAMTEVCKIPGIEKLVGVENDAPDQALIVTDLDHDNCPAIGVLSLGNCNLTNLPYQGGKEDEALVSHLRHWNREYDNGDTKLDIKIKTREVNGTRIEGTDVFLKLKNKDSINISRCEAGANCGQPSISSDRKLVVFVSGS